MKTLHKILLLAAGVLSFTACQEDEATVAKAVLANVRTLNYAGQGADPQIIKVVADADWTSEFPEWVTVSPATGKGGTTEVTVSVSENIRDGALDLPRKGDVVFKGATLRSYATVVVNQEGDLYRDLKDGSVTDAIALPEGSYLSIVGAQAVAVDADAYVLSDGQSLVYVGGTGVKVGDQVALKGLRSVHNGIPAIASPERMTASAGAEVTYPEPSAIADYDGKSIQYVTVMGEVMGAAGNYTVTVKGGSPVVSFLGDDATYADLAGHNVNLTGYAVGKADALEMIAVSVQDLGPNTTIYFQDDFEWLAEWSAASGADDSVGDQNPSGKSPSMASDANAKLAYNALLEKGYTFLNSAKNGSDWDASLTSIYLQKNYIKFGKTDYNAGIVLPALSEIEENGITVELTFDWCWHITAAKKADLMTLTLETTGGGIFSTGTSTSNKIDSGQSKVDGESLMEWQYVTIRISEVTSATRIAIHPTDPNPAVENTARRQNRWYIDNIRVTSVKD